MEDSKNIIILKTLPSNIIEKAYVVVKPNVKINDLDISSKKQKENKFILNEAENVIKDYILNIENNKKICDIRKYERKYKKMRLISILFAFLSFFCFIINFI